MVAVSAQAWVHLAAAGIGGATALVLLLARRRTGLPVGYLALAAAGTVPWSLSVTSALSEGEHAWHQALWMPSVAWTVGAFLLWALGFARYGWQPSRPLVALCLGTPVLLAVLRIAGGTSTKAPIFVFNTLYSFLLLLVIAATVTRRSKDPHPAVRGVVAVVLVGSVAALTAEALRLQFTDLAAVVALAGATVGILRAGSAVVPRPEAETLLDDLGALVLVFDEQQRLVDLNAPARLFFEVRGAEPPTPGTGAESLVGADLLTLDTVSVDLPAGDDRIGMTGYVQRLPHAGSPPRGWVVLLRRTLDRSGALNRREARRAALRLVQQSGRDGD